MFPHGVELHGVELRVWLNERKEMEGVPYVSGHRLVIMADLFKMG